MTDTITPPKAERRPLRSVVPKLILTTVYFWLPTLIFLGLAERIRGNTPFYGDVGILQAIHMTATPWLDRTAIAITTLGSAPVVIVGVLIAVGTLAYYRRLRPALFLLFSAAGTAAVNVLFKLIFHRQRPSLWQHLVNEGSYSFPSGHAMISSALALSVILLLWNTRYRWQAVAAGSAYAVLIGLSRLYLGVHYPSDVLAGWCVSLLWVVTLHQAFAYFGRRGQHTAAAPVTPAAGTESEK
jgi:membrane-associated phospholipid phosphatase